jgi:type II secretory pathway component GspD/PulD (secretin)
MLRMIDGSGRRGWLLAVVAAGCSSVSPPPQKPPASTTHVEVFEADGSPVARDWANPGSIDPAARSQGQGPPAIPVVGSRPAPEAQGPTFPESPYARFGNNIVVNRDGRITKFFYITPETGTVLLSMLKPPTPGLPEAGKPTGAGYYTAFGPAQQRPGQKPAPTGLLQRLLADHDIEIEVIGNWDRVASLDISKLVSGVLAQEGTGAVNDLLMVTADADGLEKFEQTLNLFYAKVPQIEIEAKVLEITFNETLDIGVRPVDGTTPTFGATNPDHAFIKSLTTNFPNVAAPGTAFTSEGLLTIGGIHDALSLNATLELLQSKTKGDIKSNPKIAVRNSGIAQIETTSQVPYPKARIIGNSTETSIDFKTVGIKLHIRPVIAGTETVILHIHAEVSAVTSTVATTPVPTPIVATRSATTSVHLPDGQSILIGGLISEGVIEIESKVPILGDIPILGFLFRSTFNQTTKNTVVFSITANIKKEGFRGFGLDTPIPVSGN